MTKKPWLMFLFMLSWLLSGTLQARLTIEVSGGTEGGTPIALVPFGWASSETEAPLDIASVITADLSRVGRFVLLPDEDRLIDPTRPSEVNLRNWRALGQEALVIGRLELSGVDQYTIHFQLFDVFKGDILANETIRSNGVSLRHAAHKISDIIYQKLTGEAGAFSTRIAYVMVSGGEGAEREFQLRVADADGFNPKQIVKSKEPIMSPAWSPDGRELAYVSFESGQSAIFIQQLSSGSRDKVSHSPGINGAPAWSPDGRELALTLSKGGSPDIYILNVLDRTLRQLTRSDSIDTEATWSPDGQTIVFTSNRGGKPQLYSIPVMGGVAARLTFDGDYNAGAEFSPTGEQLVLVHRNSGQFHIALHNVMTGSNQVLTDGQLDESPTFAPNSSMILYATGGGERGRLSAVSTNGRVHQKLRSDEGEVREPAWSPN